MKFKKLTEHWREEVLQVRRRKEARFYEVEVIKGEATEVQRVLANSAMEAALIALRGAAPVDQESLQYRLLVPCGIETCNEAEGDERVKVKTISIQEQEQ